MVRWIKSLLCRHDYRFYRNIYGDEIVYSGWKRSDWKCAKCGRLQLRRELYKEPPHV